jgi:hypothetical protein
VLPANVDHPPFAVVTPEEVVSGIPSWLPLSEESTGDQAASKKTTSLEESLFERMALLPKSEEALAQGAGGGTVHASYLQEGLVKV